LNRLLSKFLQLAEEGEVRPDQLRKGLEDLAEQAPEGPVREALRQAAQASDLEELKSRLEEALSHLREAQQSEGGSSPSESSKPQGNPSEGRPEASREQPKGGSVEADQGSASPPQDEGELQRADQTERADESLSPSSGGPSPEQAKGEGTESGAQAQGSTVRPGGEAPPTRGEGDSTQEGEEDGRSSTGGEGVPIGEQRAHISQSERAPDRGDGGEARTGGSDPGQQAGQDLHTSQPQESLPFQRDLLIQGGALPQDVKLLERLLTQGLPVDLAGQQPNGRPILRLDLGRVEALLQLRDLPPELRGLVRAYFLAIAAGDQK